MFQTDEKGRLQFITGVVRASYTDGLLNAKKNDSGQERFSLMMIFDPGPDVDAAWQAVCAVANAAFSDSTLSGADKLAQRIITNPLRQGAERPNDAACVGKFFMNANSKNQPLCFGFDARTRIDPREIYSGCYVRAILSLYPFEYKNEKGAVMKRGVSAGLDFVQFAKHGQRLDGAPTMEAGIAAFAKAGALPLPAPANSNAAPAMPAATFQGYATQHSPVPQTPAIPTPPAFAAPQTLPPVPANGYAPQDPGIALPQPPAYTPPVYSPPPAHANGYPAQQAVGGYTPPPGA